MKHYGDITKISGYEVPAVDVITGGSPCQDLSVAGKRAGLAGERSGLFMEQMRIVKEMRERDRKSGRTAWAVRPRYMVWENVPGAFSSGNPKGSDFAAVIEEIIKVAEPDTCVCVCVPNGGWSKSGCYYAEDGSWSIAWRVHDAQFWGVPQRRKRISLVADFGGMSAPEILFERKGMRGDSAESGTAGQGTAGGTEESAGATGKAMNPWDSQSARVYRDNGPWHSLNANESGGQSRDAVFCLQGNGIDRADTAGCNGKGWREDVCYTLNTIDRPAVMAFAQNQRDEVRNLDDIAGSLNAEPGMKQQTFVATYDARGNGNGLTVPTLTGDHQNRITDYTALCVGNGQLNQMSMSEQANTLDTMHDQQTIITFDKEMYNCGERMSGSPQAKADNVAPTVRADDHPSGVLASTVRRLTPLECERLQGYPDGWTDIGEWTDSKGKKHKEADSPRYKALGNSIALPFWEFLARRICAQYERHITMASLFDGIGGFPLAFERAGGRAVWASEIEEFPIAVTKIRFPEEEEQ